MRPRLHLSWSSLSTLERSEKEWIRIYLEGGSIPINRGMALGKRMADALEADEDTGDLGMDIVISQLPKFELMDKRMETEVVVQGQKIPIVIKPDTANKELTGFKEYKTGATKWDQRKVDEFGQITFYATGIHAMKGSIPTDIELVWAPTKKTPDGKVELTGIIKRFRTKRGLADILKMKVRMRKAWLRMEELTMEALT